MESTNGQSEDGDQSEEEEEDEDEEGGDEEGEVVGVRERAEVEGGIEDGGAGSNVEESEHEDEGADGSAKLCQADCEEAKESEASTASESGEGSGSESAVERVGSKVDSRLTVKGIRDKAASEGYQRRAREKQKYHSRRGAERIGRAKGSKAKQDNRVKLDKGGLWD